MIYIQPSASTFNPDPNPRQIFISIEPQILIR